MIHNISYYKLSTPQGVITPTLMSPLREVPLALRKPVKDLEILTTQNNTGRF